MKKERQAKIREIIENYKIDTQDELIKKLKENGFSATQATMSRDIKELKLIGKTLNMPEEEVYTIWENRIKQVLESAGMNIYSNSELINTMFDCAKKYLARQKQ